MQSNAGINTDWIIAEYKHEIDRLRGVLRSAHATIEDKSIATHQLQNYLACLQQFTSKTGE